MKRFADHSNEQATRIGDNTCLCDMLRQYLETHAASGLDDANIVGDLQRSCIGETDESRPVGCSGRMLGQPVKRRSANRRLV